MKEDDSNEKTEKLINTVSLLAEKMTKIEEFINKQAQENEKSIHKSEASKVEGRSRISGFV